MRPASLSDVAIEEREDVRYRRRRRRIVVGAVKGDVLRYIALLQRVDLVMKRGQVVRQ
jgi:hypothetical protein